MNKTFIRFLLFCFCLLSSLILFSCKSIKEPDSIPETLDYSDVDVRNSEIDRIKQLEPTEPIRALWRAILLQDEETLQSEVNLCQEKLKEAVENKNFYDAKKYYISLKSAGYAVSKETIAEIEKNIAQEQIPGLSVKNPDAPKTIEDCMNTTVTIWVDRGWKVTNGAGTVDIVIGSGFFIDKRGYIITNHHVIESMVDSKYEGFSRLYVKQLSDPDTKIPAKVIGYDSVLDLALLKAELTPECVFSLGSSSDLHIGDKVSAIGTPVGLEGTLTSGIISSTERKLITLGNVFQIDAAVNSGNSGGPLIDQNYKVQAIVFAGMLQFQGLNFAIPIEYLKQELPLLYSNGNGGEIIHPWIGAYGHTKRNGKKNAGLEIQYVLPGGSAERAGLVAGDVITQINGKEIKSLDDFQFNLMAYSNDIILNLDYINQNEEHKNCLVYLDARPEAPLLKIYNSDFITGSFLPIFGMKLVRSSTSNKNTYSVEQIIKGSTADQMSFSETDIVTVRDVKFDDENKYIAVQIYCQRKQKGFLDAVLVMGAPYDSPYYF